MIKHNKLLLPILLLILSSFSQLTVADKVVVHPDEQVAMDALLNRLGILPGQIEKFSYVKKEERYMDSYLIKNRFQYHAEYQGGISIDTNEHNRVANLRVSWTDLSDLNEISQFRDLMFLVLNSNKFTSLDGLSNLNKLKFLDVVGNELLTDLSGINNLGELKEIDAGVVKGKTIKGMKNLPSLEIFSCNRCKLNNIEPIGEFKNLKVLKLGTTVKTLAPLKNLKKLEELDVTGNNLVDISAVNGMTSIKSIIIHGSLLEEVVLSKNLVNLEYLRIIDSKLKKLPDFSAFKNMGRISIVRSNITSVEGIHGLNKLTELSLIANEKLTSVSSLKDLPMLKILEVERTPITSLGTGVFPNLVELDISGTNITKLENFSNYPKLSKLFLNKTKVTSLEGAEDAPYLWHVQTDYSLRTGENAKILRRLAKRFNKPLLDQYKKGH